MWLWIPGLVVAAFVARWGAEQLSAPLKAVRLRYGFTGAAGGPLVALGSASPDVGINTVSAITGAASIGLGSMLGSTVVSIPITVAVAYAAVRRNRSDSGDGEGDGEGDAPAEARAGELRVERQSVSIDALPYLAIVALFALLVLPPPWRGLQLIDGVIAASAYLVFLGQALYRGRGGERGQAQWSTKKTLLAVAGVVALALGAYALVTGTRQLGNAVGLSPIVSGLFITAFMTSLPQVFTTWSVVRSGQVTSGVTSVFADHAMTFTLAALPLGIVGVAINDYALVAVVMAFVALMPVLFIVLTLRRDRGDLQAMRMTDVLVFAGAVALYLAAAVLVLVGGG